ncbi:DNA-directed RNA polymerase I subunit RPA43 [Bienertia sinuspersici]
MVYNMDTLKISKANLVFYLHPSKTNSVLASIRQELSTQLFKYVEILEGVLLAFEVVDIPSKHGKILSGLHPYVAVRLKADLLLFAPKPDTFLGMLTFKFICSKCFAHLGCVLFTR